MTEPTYRDIAYGPHARNVLDLWLADSNTSTPVYVFFHGGGFYAGDKSHMLEVLLDELLAAGISVASANYRFTDDPEYFAPLLDGERAVQFLRAHAEEWNLDPARFASGGGSAGSVTSFWLGFRPDQADPTSADLVKRQSTRLSCIASYEAQTTLDPHFIRSFVAGPTWTIASIAKLCQITLDQYDTPQALTSFRELAFTEMVTPDCPPVFLFNLTPNLPMTPDLEIGPGIHHPVFGVVLKTPMDRAGVECVLRTHEQVPDLSDEAASELFQREMAVFVAGHV